MAGVLGMEKEEVEADPLAVALRAAEELGAVVALKGPDTLIAAPDGRAYRYPGGRVGLATSGSGDVLAGLVAGLLARGAEPAGAAAWGVWLHGEAGNALARRVGPIGYLARELPAEVPRLLQRLA
jgi:NAD(P)H-hydrate repair Nnr-like enzyme with NAD(P)H-hydrate dehydratase domain